MFRKNKLIVGVILSLLIILFLSIVIRSQEVIKVRNEYVKSGMYDLMNNYKLLRDNRNIYIIKTGESDSEIYKKESNKIVKLNYLNGIILDSMIEDGYLYYIKDSILNSQLSEYELYKTNLKTGETKHLLDLGIQLFRDWTLESNISVDLINHGILIYDNYLFSISSYEEDYKKYKESVDLLMENENNKEAAEVFDSYYFELNKINAD